MIRSSIDTVDKGVAGFSGAGVGAAEPQAVMSNASNAASGDEQRKQYSKT